MDERGALQSVLCAFATKVAASEASQFVIDEREKLIESASVTVSPPQKEPGGGRS
jgi:hypothetical protein